MIEVAEPPDATLAEPYVPLRECTQTAAWVQLMVTCAVPPPALQSDSKTGEALLVPPAGEKLTEDFP